MQEETSHIQPARPAAAYTEENIRTLEGVEHIRVMGLIQLEVLQELLASRFGLAVTFDKPTVVYRETIGRFLCSLSVGIGYIMAGVDKEKRGLHDFLCDTRVIYAKKIKVIPVYPRYQAPLVRPAGPGGPGNPPQPPFGGQENMAPPRDGQKTD